MPAVALSINETVRQCPAGVPPAVLVVENDAMVRHTVQLQ